MTWLWIVLGLVLLLVAVYLFLVFPAKPTPGQTAVFGRRNYAHRGYYDNEAGIPENSLAAFRRAMEAGYGCELDVQFTKDKQLIVFHDNDGKRAFGVDRPVWELTLDEIRALPLFGSGERVPLFSEVLSCVGGSQPLIVEIKAEGLSTDWYREVCEETARQLDGYAGDYCIESFHPYVVRWVRKNRPSVLRGQLVTGPHDYSGLRRAVAFCLSSLLTGCYARPQFIAYNELHMGASLRVVKALGAMSVVWTVRDGQRHEALEKTEDAIIFEHYAPAPRFPDGR